MTCRFSHKICGLAGAREYNQQSPLSPIPVYVSSEDVLKSLLFRSEDEAEIQGIGLDNDDDLFNDRNTVFQLYGTQTFGNQAFNDYQGLNDAQAVDGWKD